MTLGYHIELEERQVEQAEALKKTLALPSRAALIRFLLRQAAEAALVPFAQREPNFFERRYFEPVELVEIVEVAQVEEDQAEKERLAEIDRLQAEEDLSEARAALEAKEAAQKEEAALVVAVEEAIGIVPGELGRIEAVIEKAEWESHKDPLFARLVARLLFLLHKAIGERETQQLLSRISKAADSLALPEFLFEHLRRALNLLLEQKRLNR